MFQYFNLCATIMQPRKKKKRSKPQKGKSKRRKRQKKRSNSGTDDEDDTWYDIKAKLNALARLSVKDVPTPSRRWLLLLCIILLATHHSRRFLFGLLPSTSACKGVVQIEIVYHVAFLACSLCTTLPSQPPTLFYVYVYFHSLDTTTNRQEKTALHVLGPDG